MTTFFSQKTSKITNSIMHPTHEEVFGKQLDASYVEPLLTFDPNTVGKKCGISKLHFIAIDTSVDKIELNINKNGNYDVGGNIKNIYKNMGRFEEEDQQFSDLKRSYINLKPCEDYESSTSQHEIVVQAGEKPDWLQANWEETDWGNSIFIASLECYYLFGKIFLFYDPKKKIVTQVIEST